MWNRNVLKRLFFFLTRKQQQRFFVRAILCFACIQERPWLMSEEEVRDSEKVTRETQFAIAKTVP